MPETVDAQEPFYLWIHDPFTSVVALSGIMWIFNKYGFCAFITWLMRMNLLGHENWHSYQHPRSPLILTVLMGYYTSTSYIQWDGWMHEWGLAQWMNWWTYETMDGCIDEKRLDETWIFSRISSRMNILLLSHEDTLARSAVEEVQKRWNWYFRSLHIYVLLFCF